MVNDSKILIFSGVGIIASLFGDIDYKGSKIKGLFPYLRDRKKSKLEERSSALVDVETKEKRCRIEWHKKTNWNWKIPQNIAGYTRFWYVTDAPNVFLRERISTNGFRWESGWGITFNKLIVTTNRQTITKNGKFDK